jgi:hypothetical protein
MPRPPGQWPRRDPADCLRGHLAHFLPVMAVTVIAWLADGTGVTGDQRLDAPTDASSARLVCREAGVHRAPDDHDT